MLAQSKTIADGSIAVHPIGVAHVVEFESLLRRIAAAAGTIEAATWATNPVGAVGKILDAVKLSEVFELVDQCCKPTLKESGASLETIMDAIGAWLSLSFPAESKNPFIIAGHQILAVGTGVMEETILMLQTFSTTLRTSSAPESLPSPTSSSAQGTAALTPDGVSQSSVDGSPSSIASGLETSPSNA